MKKILLFAAAALVTVTVSAQNLKKGISGHPNTNKTIAKGELRSMKDAKITTFRSSAAIMSKKEAQFSKKVTSLKAVNQLNNVTAIRRAGTIQDSYNGSGTNYQTKQTASWKMFSGMAEDGVTPLLADVIPLPENWTSLGNIAVKYTLSGSTITIAPQCVVSGQAQDKSTIYYFLHSWASEDGSIVLTLGEDGSLTTIDGEDIAYSAFSSETFDLSQGGPYLGLVEDIEKVKYMMEGQKIIPVAGYEPRTLFLHAGPNVNGNYSDQLIMPAYANINLVNKTDVEANSYAWAISETEYNSANKEWNPIGDAITSNTKDFTFYAENTTYAPASLIATLEGESSEPFAWAGGTWNAGGSADMWDDGSSPLLTFTKANPNTDLDIINPQGCKSTIFYQGKPVSPLYFTGINLFVYQFTQDTEKELKFTCKIHKAHIDDNGKFSLGELIAQSDLTADGIETGTWMATSNLVRLNWNNFYKVDEDGMSTDVNYLLLDDEFAVVIEGWDNGSVTGKPLMFTSPYQGGISTTFAIIPGEDTYTSYGWSTTSTAFVGFIDATYGFLQTTDDTNLTIPAEGGQASITVHPMYSNNQANEAGFKTRLYLDETIEGNDIPEWLAVGFANEDYDENYTFDLVFAADALPEGVEGRKATIVFMQEGARLEVTVTQGAASGVEVTTKTVKTAETPAFNLAGQRVNKDFKGLVVKDGKKFMNK